MTDRLTELRDTIDRLDDEILALIRRRMKLSADIIAAKNGAVAYRPGREAKVVQRLVDQTPEMSPLVIQNIWRQIMTASTAQQDSSLTIAVLKNAEAVASWHFGGLVRLLVCDDMVAMRAALDGKATLAFVPVSQADKLASWMLADSGAHIMSRTPLFGEGVPAAFIIGKVPADPAAHEVTILARKDGDAAKLEIRPGRLEVLPDEDDGTCRIAGVIATGGDTD